MLRIFKKEEPTIKEPTEIELFNMLKNNSNNATLVFTTVVNQLVDANEILAKLHSSNNEKIQSLTSLQTDISAEQYKNQDIVNKIKDIVG